MIENSYLLINKAFVNEKEIKFMSMTVEVNIATVPGARISTNDMSVIDKGASVTLKTRIVSEEKLVECKNNYFRRIKRFAKEASEEYKSKFKETSEKKSKDSGFKIFYEGRVYAIGNVVSENMSMRTIVAIGKAHHLKSIKIPVWTDIRDRKLKSMIKLSFKGWPVKIQTLSDKLGAFSKILSSNDHGKSFAESITNELGSIIKSEEKSTGVDNDIFSNIKKDLIKDNGLIKINHIPFKGVNSGTSAFINGKFKELLEKVKGESNPDFLSFWQVLLDIFDTEIIFMPFEVGGSCILVKPRYDELVPSENFVNVCHFKEVTNFNRFSNSFREATRVMLNVYTDVNMESYPILTNCCHVDYNKDKGGFLYKIVNYGTDTKTTSTNSIKKQIASNEEKVKELRKEIDTILNLDDAKKTLGYNFKIEDAVKALNEKDKKIYQEKSNKAKQLEEENKNLEKQLEESAKNEQDAGFGQFVNLKASGFSMKLSSLEKNKGVVDVTRDLNFFDVVKAGNIAFNINQKESKPQGNNETEVDGLKSNLGVVPGEESKVTDISFRPSVNRVLIQNTHDLIFGERNLSFNTIFTPTILPGLPVVMFENENLDLCYSKVSSVVHNITPSSSSTDVSGTRTIDSEEGVSLSTYHTFYRQSKIDSEFITKYGIRMATDKDEKKLTVVDKTRTVEKGKTDSMPGGFSAGMSEEMTSSMSNIETKGGFRRYPIDGDYIDAKYMRLKYLIKKDPFTTSNLFDIMNKRYSFMP